MASQPDRAALKEQFASLIKRGFCRAAIRKDLDLTSSQYDGMKRRLLKSADRS